MTWLDIPGIDPALCARRNRLAALRFGVHATPIRLARDLDSRPSYARGKGPGSIADALGRINELKPPDAPTLTAEDIWVLPVMEAANSNFVQKYHLFLGASTLKNIQREAEEGFAFMNSHRTGSLSAPSELPLGRTFAGRFEQYSTGDGARSHERAMLWTYMMRGVRPNGQNGPSSDDLYKMVSGGVLSDVSMGLNGGAAMCDLCGFDIRDDKCPHVPGTDLELSKEQRTTQKMRGVPDGLATYTLEDAHPGEVSGVYAGAVPGAGFSKAVQFARNGALTEKQLFQARIVYQDIMSEGDFPMTTNNPAGDWNVNTGFTTGHAPYTYTINWGPNTGQTFQVDPEALQITMGLDEKPRPDPDEGDEGDPGDEHGFGDDLNEGEDPPEDTLEPPEMPKFSAGTPEYTELMQERQRRIALEQQVEKLRRTQLARATQDVVAELGNDGRLLPAGIPFAYALVQQLMLDDEAAGVTLAVTDNANRAYKLSRLQAFQYLFSGVPQHDLLKEHPLTELPSNSVILSAVEGDDNSEEERLRAKTRMLAAPKSASSNGSTNGRANNHKHG